MISFSVDRLRVGLNRRRIISTSNDRHSCLVPTPCAAIHNVKWYKNESHNARRIFFFFFSIIIKYLVWSSSSETVAAETRNGGRFSRMFTTGNPRTKRPPSTNTNNTIGRDDKNTSSPRRDLTLVCAFAKRADTPPLLQRNNIVTTRARDLLVFGCPTTRK